MLASPGASLVVLATLPDAFLPLPLLFRLFGFGNALSADSAGVPSASLLFREAAFFGGLGGAGGIFTWGITWVDFTPSGSRSCLRLLGGVGGRLPPGGAAARETRLLRGGGGTDLGKGRSSLMAPILAQQVVRPTGLGAL